ncbi:MAG: glycosyltransferase family 2 protein [Proteobacteria bacterium]|nr:glycosyltransferase family 2 protein [Pseudomonadota bacterium]
MTSHFNSNLSLLKKHNKDVYKYISAQKSTWKERSLPTVNSVCQPISLNEFRSTTLIYFGIDNGLVTCINALNGENNLIVVEDDIDVFLSFLSTVDNPKIFNPGCVQWIFDPTMIGDLNPEELFLGRTAVLNPDSAKQSELTIAVLRFVKEQTLKMNQRRSECNATYLVMVTYNRLTLTRLTLERLDKNTTLPMKLVIVDNNSTDGTRDWLKENMDRYLFIEKLFLTDDNLGIGRALNNGMSYALSRSNKVGRIDNDVLVPPHWLEDFTSVIESDLKPMVVGGYVTDDDIAKEQIKKASKEVVKDLKVYFVDYAGGCLNLYQPNLFDKLGFFPEYPLYGVEDGGLCEAARGAGEKVIVVDNVKVEHLPSLFDEETGYVNFKQDQLKIHCRAVMDAKVKNKGCSDLSSARLKNIAQASRSG